MSQSIMKGGPNARALLTVRNKYNLVVCRMDRARREISAFASTSAFYAVAPRAKILKRAFSPRWNNWHDTVVLTGTRRSAAQLLQVLRIVKHSGEAVRYLLVSSDSRDEAEFVELLPDCGAA